MQLEQLLTLLGYTASKNYRAIGELRSPLTAHLFRAAAQAKAKGAYVFHASPADEILPVRPAVYIAEANTRDEAREIHQNLWNLGNAPFLLVLLPNEVRIYTGFDYDSEDEARGLIDEVPFETDLFGDVEAAVAERLKAFSAKSIDDGDIWKLQTVDLENRVDRRLLNNLTKLEEELINNELELPREKALPVAHSLIGKYVYIRYLRDREILSDEWLAENGINLDLVLGRNATLAGLTKLTEALEKRFNGALFPFPAQGLSAVTDRTVSLIASAFKGDDPKLRQLHLDFEPYNFFYIPVETLSSIYEKFLRAQGQGKKVGAVYTPEPLADYLLCEMEHAHPLSKGMKVLDPCCGSGVFLVLAYRRLIELELADNSDLKLRPEQLRQLLVENLRGVERNPEACYVTEFSLILTMLNYIDPPDLHLNRAFKFPELHNKQIFECDFFEEGSLFSKLDELYDWVIGNPPWIEPASDSEDEEIVLNWIKQNRRERPVAGNRVAEAFSWRAADFVNADGCVGIIMPAKSLFNHESKRFRKAFCKKKEIVRVTNFSNLVYVLFDGRGQLPAATLIYHDAKEGKEKPPIVHCGPFVLNQVANRSWQGRGKRATWIITINENEIQTVNPYEAEDGEAITWKLALWGNHRDKRATNRLRNLFATNLDELSKAMNWNLVQGLKLRKDPALRTKKEKKEDVEPTTELRGKKVFLPAVMVKSGYRFTVPQEALEKIPKRMQFLRTRSGKEGLNLISHPHMVLNAAYFVYSGADFVIPAPQTGLSSNKRKDADHFRALSVFLSSSISQYYLFFVSPSWGIDRSTVYAKDIKKIPLPKFSQTHIQKLAEIHRELGKAESRQSTDRAKLQELLDSKVERLFGVPKNISVLAKDLLQIRLGLNKGKSRGHAVEHPEVNELRDYGNTLRKELDDFTQPDIQHKVSLSYSSDLIVCTIELVRDENEGGVSVEKAPKTSGLVLNEISKLLTEQYSQWVYVKRRLVVLQKSKIHLCKAPRLIEWSKSQALLDSDDIIAEIITRSSRPPQVKLDALSASQT